VAGAGEQVVPKPVDPLPSCSALVARPQREIPLAKIVTRRFHALQFGTMRESNVVAIPLEINFQDTTVEFDGLDRPVPG
jgi:hypothetical protein